MADDARTRRIKKAFGNKVLKNPMGVSDTGIGPMTAHIDREGKPIQAHRWTTLRGNLDYCQVRRYENEKSYLSIEWIGKITNARDIPREYWKLFTVHVGNIIITGDRPGTYAKKRVEDPQLTKSFGDEKSAVGYYMKLLMEWGLLTIEEDYEGVETITEIGNLISQPTLTDASAVVTESEAKPKNASFGSW